MRVLVVNAGSSSLKLRLIGGDDELAGSEDVDAPEGVADASAVAAALGRLGDADAVGHRVVHGGERFTAPVVVTPEVETALRALVPLAPLHQPAALAGMAAVESARPGLAAVACFDTAFHAGLPVEACTYALPQEWRERWGLRRYGFHGLSHAWAARQAAGYERVVTCHLGAGASLAAVRGGRSVDTTMGFTPVEGLVMATRSGSVDPGLLVWLLQEAGVGVDELGDALERRSGLAALAGTGDMRTVLARTDADASLALGVYVHRLRAGIAAMAASLGGLDALVFTGGVGEHAVPVRDAAVEGVRFLGGFEVLVVESREDLQVAAEVRSVLAG